jgi:AmiR/NasT family two-component response regulator
MNHKEHIVLAENEPIVAMHIESRLAEAGYDMPETAVTYKDMVKKLQWRTPNLIIMDQAFVKQPRDLKKALALHDKYHVAIVLLVDWMTDELRKVMKKTPFLFPLEKPFVNDDFDSTIFRALSYNSQMN